MPVLDRPPAPLRLDEPAPPRYAVRSVAGSHPAAELGRALEHEVFADAFGNTREQLDEEYRPYDPASVFLLVIDRQLDQAVGTMRVIVPNPVGLKSVDDLARAPWREDPAAVLARTRGAPDLATTWDIATLAVPRAHRGFGRIVSRALTSMFAHLTMASLATHAPARSWVTMLDLPVLELMQHTWNRPFVSWPGVTAGPYLDSAATLPVWADTRAWAARCREEAPRLHRQMTHTSRPDHLVAYPSTPVALAPFLAATTQVATTRGSGLPHHAPWSNDARLSPVPA